MLKTEEVSRAPEKAALGRFLHIESHQRVQQLRCKISKGEGWKEREPDHRCGDSAFRNDPETTHNEGLAEILNGSADRLIQILSQSGFPGSQPGRFGPIDAANETVHGHFHHCSLPCYRAQ